jgi:hypothetical protein
MASFARRSALALVLAAVLCMAPAIAAADVARKVVRLISQMTGFLSFGERGWVCIVSYWGRVWFREDTCILLTVLVARPMTSPTSACVDSQG